MPENRTLPLPSQSPGPQVVGPKHTAVRRRKCHMSRGALEALDAAIEARGTTEEPAREWQIVRPDVQDEFAVRTRTMLRRLEGELRNLRAEMRGKWAA